MICGSATDHHSMIVHLLVCELQVRLEQHSEKTQQTAEQDQKGYSSLTLVSQLFEVL